MTLRDQITGAFGLRVWWMMGIEGEKVLWLNTQVCFGPWVAIHWDVSMGRRHILGEEKVLNCSAVEAMLDDQKAASCRCQYFRRKHGNCQCSSGSWSHAENASAYLMSLSFISKHRTEERRWATHKHGVCATSVGGPQGSPSSKGMLLSCVAAGW